MNVSDFDYDLPEALIAQQPIEPRDASRLLVMDRATGECRHQRFYDLPRFLYPGDVLVMNNTRVIAARLNAIKAETGGAVEILLLRQIDDTCWRALLGGRRVDPGLKLNLPGTPITAEVEDALEGAERIVRFSEPINARLGQIGTMPLPPYIHTPLADSERYQTVYNRDEGSAAAPTAGLHFTGELMLKLREQGIQFAYCTLHIGLGTFQPVTAEQVEEHHIHSEFAILSAENAQIVNQAKLAGRRIIAVGTTSARTLETAAILSAGGDPARPSELPDACPWRPVTAFKGDTSLFIYPGYQWRVVDAMITNFHLPRSTLLMMISAFAGREHVLNAYEIAKREGYRFYSFGDAMFIA